MRGELGDALLALGGGEGAGHGSDLDRVLPALDRCSRRCSATYSAVGMKRQKTIGLCPCGEQLVDELDRRCSFGSLLAGERGSVVRELAEPGVAAYLRSLAAVLSGLVAGAGCDVEALGVLVAGLVEHGAAAELVGLLDGAGLGVVRAVAQCRDGGGRARAERAQQPERGPPVHALAAAVALGLAARSRARS